MLSEIILDINIGKLDKDLWKHLYIDHNIGVDYIATIAIFKSIIKFLF